jgi:hypothetical protein
VRLEGLGQLKNPMTSSGIEPATFWLVAECLNQLRYRVPQYHKAPPMYWRKNGVVQAIGCIVTVEMEPCRGEVLNEFLTTFLVLFQKFVTVKPLTPPFNSTWLQYIRVFFLANKIQ